MALMNAIGEAVDDIVALQIGHFLGCFIYHPQKIRPDRISSVAGLIPVRHDPKTIARTLAYLISPCLNLDFCPHPSFDRRKVVYATSIRVLARQMVSDPTF